MSSVLYFAVFYCNSYFTQAWLLLISCHGNKLFSFSELGSLTVVIFTTPMFILPCVHEIFTVKFTMSKVVWCIVYMYIGCLTVHSGGIIFTMHNISNLDRPCQHACVTCQCLCTTCKHNISCMIYCAYMLCLASQQLQSLLQK